MDDLKPDPEFDSMLQKWAAELPPIPIAERQLVAKIISAAQERVNPAKGVERLWKQRLLLISSGGVLALVAFLLILTRPSQDEAVRQALANVAEMPSRHLKTLTKESQALFGNRIAWLADSNSQFLLGLDDETASAASAPNVAVHMVVFRRTEDGKQWRPQWKTTVVVRNDEQVQISLAKERSQLRLWAHILPDQKIAVDSDFHGDNPHAANWRPVTVPLAAEPELVLSAVDSEGEFQVWQSALVLQEDTL